VDGFGGIDILVTRISILFVIIVVITVTPRSIIDGLWSIIISKLLSIDVLEEMAVLHSVIGLGMDLVGTLQSFVVILLVVTVTSRFLDRVDLMVAFAGALASVLTVIIRPPITVVLVVMIVVVALVVTFVVVVPTMVIRFVILAWWVLGA
jgi:hypothetical protein